jgi:type II secretory pathway pseudopilin PulG
MPHLLRRSCLIRNRGYTFLGLMIIVAVMGVGLLTIGEFWHSVNIREKEEELLFVGDQYQQAIKAYYAHSPNKLQPYPMNLEDMLKDPRYPTTQRYLRKIYNDPIQGTSEWGLLKNATGGIIGIYSLSEEMPIKQGNFRLKYQGFEGKTKYSEWVFMYVPPTKNLSRLQ